MFIAKTSEFTNIIVNREHRSLTMQSANKCIFCNNIAPEILTTIMNALFELIELQSKTMKAREYLGFKEKVPTIVTQQDMEDWLEDLGLQVTNITPTKIKEITKVYSGSDDPRDLNI